VNDEAETKASLTPCSNNLELFARHVLKQSRTWFTPDVVLLTGPAGERYVLKDFSTRPMWARALWCRASVRRETRAYEQLHDIPGIPRLIYKLSPDAFIMEFLEGTPLPRRKYRDVLGMEFFVRLNAVLDEMHARGIAHGDLRRKNILVGPTGQPCLIDFETSFSKGRGLLRQFFETVTRIDKLTVLKIKSRYFPDRLTDVERQQLGDAPWHLRAGRFLRKRVYGPISPKRIKKRLLKK
jgi:predicted Ser/Thr protein kinase